MWLRLCGRRREQYRMAAVFSRCICSNLYTAFALSGGVTDSADVRLTLKIGRERTVLDGTLSQRELEIARAYATGQTYHQIARHFHIAPSTVRTHLATIYRKLGVSSKIELHAVLSGATAIEIPQGEERESLISELALSLEEAISRERALGEVLRIISRSQGQLADVIASVLDHALELCDAEFGILFEYSDRKGYTAAYSKGGEFRREVQHRLRM